MTTHNDHEATAIALFVTCKRCEGEGRLWADGKAHYAFEKIATVDCPLCGGTGQMGPDVDAIARALDEQRERDAKVADMYAAEASSPFVVMPKDQADIAIEAAQIITAAIRRGGA